MTEAVIVIAVFYGLVSVSVLIAGIASLLEARGIRRRAERYRAFKGDMLRQADEAERLGLRLIHGGFLTWPFKPARFILRVYREAAERQGKQ